MLARIQPTGLILVVVVLALRSTLAWGAWQVDGVPVCAAASNQLGTVSVSDGAGGAIVAWYDYRSGDADIYVQHLLPSGVTDFAWPASGVVLCAATGGQEVPAIVSDGAGGAIVTWQDDRGPNSDIYAQRVRSTGVVDPAWPTNGRALCAASGDQVDPAIASDGAGGAIVTWRDTRGGPDTDVYAQRVRATGAVDPAWPTDGRALCTAPGNQSVPTIASDGASGALVVWSDLRNGVDSDIYGHHVLASGAVDPAWPANGRALCAVPGNQSGPTIVGDGSGGAIIAWFDYRSDLDADIYAHHVLAGGTMDPAWPTNGRALCTAVGEQYSPMVVSDGLGGAIVAWYDYRSGDTADVYARRVRASGAADPAWPTDGLALCTAAGDQTTPVLVPDGAGGAVAAWLDYRNGPSSDIVAQRVLPDGTRPPGWPVDGLALCTAPGDQYTPAPTPDGLGGVIVAWVDFRPGVYSDVYAQRAFAAGGVAAVAPESRPDPSLHLIRPNPARGDAVLRFDLPRPSRVTADVTSASGRRVRILLRGQELEAGVHEIVWDGADGAGVRQPAGVYWIRVTTAAGSSARTLALLR